jgi:hypothetical protein
MPVLPGLARSLDRTLDLVRAALVDVGEDVVLVVRLDSFERLARPDLFAADDRGDVEPLALHLRESALEVLAFG